MPSDTFETFDIRFTDMDDTHMQFRIELFDENPESLGSAEFILNRLCRKYDISAKVYSIYCHLEITRSGLSSKLPVLKVNGNIALMNEPLVLERLEWFARELAAQLKRQS